ncbi:hypothetical protein [Streptomyces sp. NPDC002067]
MAANPDEQVIGLLTGTIDAYFDEVGPDRVRPEDLAEILLRALKRGGVLPHRFPLTPEDLAHA